MNSLNPVHVPREVDTEASISDQRRSNTKPVLESHLELLREGTFSDVTFIVGPGKERIPGHQLFLKARSPVFQVMFSERWSQVSIKVPLEDVDPNIFKKFLEYIYADIFVANVSEALELLQVAHMYDVQSLVSNCEKLLESEVTLDDAVDVFQAARKYDKIQLMDKVGDLMTKSLFELQGHPSLFSRVDKFTLMYILKRNDLKMREVDLFRLVLKWAQIQPVWTVHLCDILPLIRFPLMSLNEFTAVVVPTGLLSQSTLVELFTYFGSDYATKKSLARTLKFSTHPRKSADSIVSVALYPGDIVNMSTRRQQFCQLKERLQFVFRTDCSETRPSSSDLQWKTVSSMPSISEMDGGKLKSIGLNGISIYCPSRPASTASGMVATSFKDFKILVRVKFPIKHGVRQRTTFVPNLKDLLSIASVRAEEGKITEIKFDTVVTLEDQQQYHISVEEIVQTCTPGYMPSSELQSYDAKDFGNNLTSITVKFDEKPMSIQSVQSTSLLGCQRQHRGQIVNLGHLNPCLICNLSLQEF